MNLCILVQQNTNLYTFYSAFHHKDLKALQTHQKNEIKPLN